MRRRCGIHYSSAKRISTTKLKQMTEAVGGMPPMPQRGTPHAPILYTTMCSGGGPVLGGGGGARLWLSSVSARK
jgi:hypothetical protein